LRYALFSFGHDGESLFALIIGIALHGICYDFFFVSGQIYTDSKAGKSVKSAAQGLITLATYGLGMLIGFWIAGMIADQNVLGDDNHSWANIWKFPAIFAAGVMVFFFVFFKNEEIEYSHA
jgi:MFS family permease